MTIIRSGRGPNPLRDSRLIRPQSALLDATCSAECISQSGMARCGVRTRGAVSCASIRTAHNTGCADFRSAISTYRVRRGQPADGDAAERLAFASTATS